MRARIVSTRETEVPRIFERVRAEFASDISAGRLRVSLAPRTIRYNGTDDLSGNNGRAAPRAETFSSKQHCNGYTPPPDETVQARCEAAAQIELQQKRVALNPLFAGSGVFPKSEHVDCSRTIRIMLLKDLIELTASHLPINHERVQPLLRMKVQSVKQGLYARELAYELFRNNRLNWRVSTNREPVWPSGTDDPRRMTELMFRETLFPKETICRDLTGRSRQACLDSPTGLGMDGPGRPITSTLGRERAIQQRVMEIDMTSLDRAMRIPNDHRELRQRF
jgi:hypothetical protein